ncbi:MAG: hypothetical protein V4732_20565 [Pseudomonadota bacterium]
MKKILPHCLTFKLLPLAFLSINTLAIAKPENPLYPTPGKMATTCIYICESINQINFILYNNAATAINWQPKLRTVLSYISAYYEKNKIKKQVKLTSAIKNEVLPIARDYEKPASSVTVKIVVSENKIEGQSLEVEVAMVTPERVELKDFSCPSSNVNTCIDGFMREIVEAMVLKYIFTPTHAIIMD